MGNEEDEDGPGLVVDLEDDAVVTCPEAMGVDVRELGNAGPSWIGAEALECGSNARGLVSRELADPLCGARGELDLVGWLSRFR